MFQKREIINKLLQEFENNSFNMIITKCYIHNQLDLKWAVNVHYLFGMSPLSQFGMSLSERHPRAVLLGMLLT